MNTVLDSAEYIHCDDDVQCYGDLSENEIITIIKDNPPNAESMVPEDDEEDVDPIRIPTLSEALTALNVLQKYCFHKNIDASFDQMETEIIKESSKLATQKSIPDYFS